MIFETLFFWIGSIIGMVGTYLISKHDRKGFIFYIVSNPILVIYGLITGSWAIIALFVFNTIFAVKGYYEKDGGWNGLGEA